MDFIILTICALAALVSYVILSLGRRRMGLFFNLVAWVFCVPWLAFYAGAMMGRTDAYSLTTWTDQAEMGPVTLVVAVLGLTIWFMGDHRSADPA